MTDSDREHDRIRKLLEWNQVAPPHPGAQSLFVLGVNERTGEIRYLSRLPPGYKVVTIDSDTLDREIDRRS